MTTIQERIDHIQQLMKLSDAEMAKKLGIEETLYRQAITDPDAHVIERVCTSLGVSRAYLEKGEGPVFSGGTLPVADILAFRDARNWKQFHTPKDLAISLNLEASELLECFQWSGKDVYAKEKQAEMEDELADILIYAVLFADAIGADIPSIIHQKLQKNGEKYQVEKAYGSAKKYTEL
ncbi:MAG: MazG-like family protein [Sphaerochaetaceae bacterium]